MALTTTLADARPGDRLIIEPATGTGIQRRLWDLGVLPGSIVEVVASHPFRGPVVVMVGASQVAIGRGLASSITVSKAKGMKRRGGASEPGATLSDPN